MREGDWVLARKSDQYFLAYIDFFSHDHKIVYITRVARTVEGILLRLAHSQTICEIGMSSYWRSRCLKMTDRVCVK